jgi:hypothetical protein
MGSRLSFAASRSVTAPDSGLDHIAVVTLMSLASHFAAIIFGLFDVF